MDPVYDSDDDIEAWTHTPQEAAQYFASKFNAVENSYRTINRIKSRITKKKANLAKLERELREYQLLNEERVLSLKVTINKKFMLVSDKHPAGVKMPEEEDTIIFSEEE